MTEGEIKRIKYVCQVWHSVYKEVTIFSGSLYICWVINVCKGILGWINN